MATYNMDDQTVDLLQDLLSINMDSEKGFEEAAEHVNEPELKSLFRDFSQRRSHNAAELREAISSAGKEPTTHGSASGAIHRWWIDAKQAMTGKDPESVLNEAERGEDSIKNEYEDALEELSDPVARDLVDRQFQNVQEGHDRVKSLRDSYRMRRNPRE